MKPKNKYTLNWLVDIIEVGLNIEGLPELKLINRETAAGPVKVKWFKYSFRTPDDGAKTEQMYSRLKAQNSGLIVEDWKIDFKRIFSDEVWLIVRVLDSAHRFIKEKKGNLNYGLTKIKFIFKDAEEGDEYVGKKQRI